MEDVVVDVEHLSKCYKLYDRPVDRLKEALHPLRRSYHRDFFALRDISFTVRRGETVGIIGKNGSGKSTLLKMITGVLTPSGGSKVIRGRISALLELGAGFNPEFTGIENIYMNGTILGYSKQEMAARLGDIVAFADIGDFIHQPVKMYSSGMFARLAFAVAINVEPDILIVDEALSVGDVFFQNKCFKRFEDLKRRGVTILFVSHDMGSIRQLTSRVLWLEHGRSRMFGETEVVCEAYFKEQVREQNRVNAEVRDSGSGGRLAKVTAGGAAVQLPLLGARSGETSSEGAAIRSFFFRDVDGQQVSRLLPGHRYEAVFAAEFAQPLMNVIFGFMLEDSKGIQLLGMNSYINNDEQLIRIDCPGVMVVSFAFVLPRVRKGEYLISPAIAQGVQRENVVLAWMPGALKVVVENTGYNLSLLEIPAEVSVKRYEADQVTFLK